MKQWKINKSNFDTAALNLSKNLGISDAIARILTVRGVTTEQSAHSFLYGTLSDLHNQLLLPDIEKACVRIKKALSNKENILIYGDYDVDGISACVLLHDFLKKRGGRVSYYIPDRIEEGYGLNTSVFPFAKENEVSLIITVDCGISAFEEVEFFNRNSIDVIITDHHKTQGSSLPPAFAVVCPQRTDCDYPFKELSGVGVAFKLAQALSDNAAEVFDYLDLVALGTVADVVPLLDENRILVKEGMKRMTVGGRKGLNALIKVSGLTGKDICSRHIGYILGPRINASGRLGSADHAVKLLMSEDEGESGSIAEALHKSNRDRQKLQEQMVNEALAKVRREVNFKEQRVIVLENEGWHAGLIGIVASRISQEFYRPSIIISTKDSPGKGSGRSIKNFHLFNAIKECRHLLVNYGGHENACGLSILKDKIEEFTNHINDFARNVLQPEDLTPSLEIDIEFPLAQISRKFIEELDLLAPFGCNNPEPVFLTRGLSFKNKPASFGKNHFRGWVTDGQNVCEAVGFGMAPLLHGINNRKFDAVYYPCLNEWAGIETVRLSLTDVKPAE
ncbi:MAG: single-stranded-DNA-specific exonuclease RecJ [Candidatus Omnitrophota bacterium]